MPPTSRSTEERKRGVRFDPTVNLGHILTFVGFIAAGFGAYGLIDKRVTVLEVRSERAQQDASAARAETRDTLRDMRDDIKELARLIREPRADRK